MMTLADITAVRAWAEPGPEGEGTFPLMTAVSWSDASCREIRQVAAGELGLSPSRKDPLHVLVSDGASRPRADWLRAHVWGGRVPAGSLYRYAPSVNLPSPEFCFLQMAGRRTLPELAAVGMELTGLYGRVQTARGFVDREPVATVDSIRDLLSRAGGCYGIDRARRTLEWVMPGSRSPMETVLALVLTLPQRYGGYGLPRPTLNARVARGADQLMISQAPWYELDLSWPARKTCAEYDSYDNHTSAGALDHDSMKWNSLVSMGWTVFSVTFAQMSGVSLDILANQIGKALGVTVRPPMSALRNELLDRLMGRSCA